MSKSSARLTDADLARLSPAARAAIAESAPPAVDPGVRLDPSDGVGCLRVLVALARAHPEIARSRLVKRIVGTLARALRVRVDWPSV